MIADDLKALIDRREALIAQLREVDGELADARALLTMTAVSGHRYEPASPARSVPRQYEGMTVREIVTEKLRQNPGFTGGDLTRALRADGFGLGGSTRFSHRIYNEVWRMTKDGLAKKRPDGGFELTEPCMRGTA